MILRHYPITFFVQKTAEKGSKISARRLHFYAEKKETNAYAVWEIAYTVNTGSFVRRWSKNHSFLKKSKKAREVAGFLLFLTKLIAAVRRYITAAVAVVIVSAAAKDVAQVKIAVQNIQQD